MNKTRTFIKRVVVGAAFLAVVGNLVGCRNTANGFGKDVEHTGEKIQEKTE